MIVDAHAHIFRLVNGMNKEGPTRGLGYGAVAVADRRVEVIPPLCEQTTHTPEMLTRHMDIAGVDKAVLLQGPFYGECNQYVCDAVRKYPGRFVGFAYLDPWHRDGRTALQEISATPEFVGVKIEFSEATGLSGIHPGARLDDPGVEWLWEELERAGMVAVVDLGAVGATSYQTDSMQRIAEGRPNLTMVIAHLAQPTPTAESDPDLWRRWTEQIELGLLPNVYFDTASLPAYVAAEGYPFPTAGRYVAEAIRRIGSRKIMWGTDIPALLQHATYPQLLRAAHAHVESLSGSDRAAVLGGNAARVFRRGGALRRTDSTTKLQA